MKREALTLRAQSKVGSSKNVLPRKTVLKHPLATSTPKEPHKKVSKTAGTKSAPVITLDGDAAQVGEAAGAGDKSALDPMEHDGQEKLDYEPEEKEKEEMEQEVEEEEEDNTVYGEEEYEEGEVDDGNEDIPENILDADEDDLHHSSQDDLDIGDLQTAEANFDSQLEKTRADLKSVSYAEASTIIDRRIAEQEAAVAADGYKP